jgi:hypothetical protein
MRFSRLMAVTLMFLFVVVQGGIPVSAHDKADKKDTKPKQERSMKEEFKDVGKAVKKDSKAAGHEIKHGFEDIGSEVKDLFKKK